MRFKEDSILLLLPTNAAIFENFLLPKYIRPKISALTVRPRNQKSEFSPLFSLLSGWNNQSWNYKSWLFCTKMSFFIFRELQIGFFDEKYTRTCFFFVIFREIKWRFIDWVYDLNSKQVVSFVFTDFFLFAVADLRYHENAPSLMPGFCLPKGITPILPIFR